MPKQNHTEIIFILDKSDSMNSIKTDAIGGFNAYIDSQKKLEGTASITLILFNTERKIVYSNISINEVPLLTEQSYVPNGCTALLDTIGFVIDSVGHRLNQTLEDERPQKVMICILTDGEENSSKKFTNQQIQKKIEHQRTVYSWEFSYLGANQDAFAIAKNLNIDSKYTANFAANSRGVCDAYASLSRMTQTYRKS